MSIFTFLKRINSLFLALSIGLLLISACGEDGESEEQWSAYENNPIIQAGDFLQRAIWNDPCVLKEGGQYIMYMTTSPSDNPFNPPVLPYRAISDDGISWQLDSQASGPLLDESGTPFASIETPSVVFFKNKYHMFFTGVYPEGGTHYMAVGHAVSDDGLLWVKDTAPLLEPTGNVWDWNGFLVAEPGAAVFKNKIYLYFTAMGQHSDGTQWQSIGLVTSNDGINFSSQKMVLEQSDKYPVSEGFVGYSTPSATVYDNRVHLFYDAAKGQPSYRQVALHHAVSDDGETNFVEDARSIFTCDSFDWIRGEVRAPSALFEDGLIKLWFAGNVPPGDLGPLVNNDYKGREIGIGYATKKIEK